MEGPRESDADERRGDPTPPIEKGPFPGLRAGKHAAKPRAQESQRSFFAGFFGVTPLEGLQKDLRHQAQVDREVPKQERQEGRRQEVDTGVLCRELVGEGAEQECGESQRHGGPEGAGKLRRLSGVHPGHDESGPQREKLGGIVRMISRQLFRFRGGTSSIFRAPLRIRLEHFGEHHVTGVGHRQSDLGLHFADTRSRSGSSKGRLGRIQA